MKTLLFRKPDELNNPEYLSKLLDTILRIAPNLISIDQANRATMRGSISGDSISGEVEIDIPDDMDETQIQQIKQAVNDFKLELIPQIDYLSPVKYKLDQLSQMLLDMQKIKSINKDVLNYLIESRNAQAELVGILDSMLKEKVFSDEPDSI